MQRPSLDLLEPQQCHVLGRHAQVVDAGERRVGAPGWRSAVSSACPEPVPVSARVRWATPAMSPSRPATISSSAAGP